MKSRGSAMTSAGMICSVLSLALVLLTIPVRAQPVLDATCTGEPDVPWSEQIAGCTKAASLDPDNALVFVGRGMVHVATGDLDRAMADFEQAIRLQPALAAGLYWRGIARRLKGDAAAGEADIQAARKIDPKVDR